MKYLFNAPSVTICYARFDSPIRSWNLCNARLPLRVSVCWRPYSAQGQWSCVDRTSNSPVSPPSGQKVSGLRTDDHLMIQTPRDYNRRRPSREQCRRCIIRDLATQHRSLFAPDHCIARGPHLGHPALSFDNVALIWISPPPTPHVSVDTGSKIS